MNSTLPKREVITLCSVALVGFCGLLGLDIHLASLPYIMTFMKTDSAHMQQSVSIYLLGMGLSVLIYGPLSDKVGRKPVVVFGLLLASLASFASVWTVHIAPFLVTRFLQGTGAGVCMGLGRTMIADRLQGRQLAIIGSYFAMIISLSPLIGPPLGGYFQHWFSWQANFIFLGFFLLIVNLLFICFCPETNAHKDPHAFRLKSMLFNYWSLLTHPAFMMASLLSALAMSANMVYPTVSSILFQLNFHISPITYGWLTMLLGLGTILSKLCSPTILKRLGGSVTLVYGLWSYVLGGLWVALLYLFHENSITTVMIGVFIIVFATPFIMPILMSLALSIFHQKRGVASSIYASLQLVIAFGFSFVLSLLSGVGVIIMGAAYLFLGIVGLLIFHFGLKSRLTHLLSPYTPS